MKIKRGDDSYLFVDISSWTIIKVILFILLTVLLYYIKNVLLMLFVVMILVAAMSPTVEWLQKRKIPKLLSVIIVFLILLLFLGLLAFIVFPPLLGQLQQFATEFPVRLEEFINDNDTQIKIISVQDWLKDAGLVDNLGQALDIAYSQVNNLSEILISQTFGLINAVILGVTIFALTFYLLLEEEGMKNFLMTILPHQKQVSIFNTLQKVNKKTGLWLRGQLIVSTTIGLMTYVGMLILGVKFPVVLAIVAGILSIIPIVGPIIAVIPAVMVALTQSPLLALAVILVTMFIQQIEGQFITPKIMGKIVGLSPVTVISSLLIGGTLAGVWGMMIAIPAAAAVSVIIQEWDHLK